MARPPALIPPLAFRRRRRRPFLFPPPFPPLHRRPCRATPTPLAGMPTATVSAMSPPASMCPGRSPPARQRCAAADVSRPPCFPCFLLRRPSSCPLIPAPSPHRPTPKAKAALDTDPVGRHPENHKFRDEPAGLESPWSQSTRATEERPRAHCCCLALPWVCLLRHPHASLSPKFSPPLSRAPSFLLKHFRTTYHGTAPR